MASPQMTNGFTQIANTIIDALCCYRLPGEEMQILWVVIRQSYGFNRKTAEVSLSEFATKTGLKRPNVSRALNGLVSKKILGVIKNDTGSNNYLFNKDFAEWVPGIKKDTGGINIDNKPGIKKDTHYMKEKIKERYMCNNGIENDTPPPVSQSKSDGIENDTPLLPIVTDDPATTPRHLFDLWNETFTDSTIPLVREFNKSREQKCRIRIKERTLDEWRKVFRICLDSPFLRGEIGEKPNWFTFDWIITNDNNSAKVLEGKYSRSFGKQNQSNTGGYEMFAGVM